jgi:hypothetical protein
MKGGEIMNIYQVRVTGYRPYPIVREYTEKASGWGTAINRAVRKYMKEVNGRKRMKNMTVSVGRGILAKPTTI